MYWWQILGLILFVGWGIVLFIKDLLHSPTLLVCEKVWDPPLKGRTSIEVLEDAYVRLKDLKEKELAKPGHLQNQWLLGVIDAKMSEAQAELILEMRRG